MVRRTSPVSSPTKPAHPRSARGVASLRVGRSRFEAGSALSRENRGRAGRAGNRELRMCRSVRKGAGAHLLCVDRSSATGMEEAWRHQLHDQSGALSKALDGAHGAASDAAPWLAGLSRSPRALRCRTGCGTAAQPGGRCRSKAASPITIRVGHAETRWTANGAVAPIAPRSEESPITRWCHGATTVGARPNIGNRFDSCDLPGSACSCFRSWPLEQLISLLPV